MVDHKQLLHEFLKENQEPFHLKRYIAERRSQLKKPPLTIASLQLKKNKTAVTESSTSFAKRTSFCKHACFLSFHNSPDVRKSPFLEFPSPLKSPCKSSPAGGAVFLHIPSKTAALLVEAAMRIQKQQQSKPKSHIKNAAGIGLFGSFMKKLKYRNKNKKKRAIVGSNDLKFSSNNKPKLEEKTEEHVRISYSCSADWEASTSNCRYEYDCFEEMVSDGFNSQEKSFCTSPLSTFRFSLHRSPSYSGSPGSRTPYFSSPAASPGQNVKQEKNNQRYKVNEDKDNYGTKSPTKTGGEEEGEEKEQCSPVSVLDPPFEDDEHESVDVEEDDDDDDDYNLDCSYANVQRAKQQLLYRLRRFEKLAELDPMELERKMLEDSDQDINEDESEDDDEPLSLYEEQRRNTVDGLVTEVINNSSFQQRCSRKMSTDMKRLVSDLIVEEKGKKSFLSTNKEVVLGRICNRLDSWKEVEFDTIDMMVELDFKKDIDGWKEFQNQVDETTTDIEVEIFGLLMGEISEELFYMDDAHYQETYNLPTTCT